MFHHHSLFLFLLHFIQPIVPLQHRVFPLWVKQRFFLVNQVTSSLLTHPLLFAFIPSLFLIFSIISVMTFILCWCLISSVGLSRTSYLRRKSCSLNSEKYSKSSLLPVCPLAKQIFFDPLDHPPLGPLSFFLNFLWDTENSNALKTPSTCGLFHSIFLFLDFLLLFAGLQ